MTCVVSILILRFVREFETPLLLQSLIMIVTMLELLRVGVAAKKMYPKRSIFDEGASFVLTCSMFRRGDQLSLLRFRIHPRLVLELVLVLSLRLVPSWFHWMRRYAYIHSQKCVVLCRVTWFCFVIHRGCSGSSAMVA
jgi:hypothetical protein